MLRVISLIAGLTSASLFSTIGDLQRTSLLLVLDAEDTSAVEFLRSDHYASFAETNLIRSKAVQALLAGSFPEGYQIPSSDFISKESGPAIEYLMRGTSSSILEVAVVLPCILAATQEHSKCTTPQCDAWKRILEQVSHQVVVRNHQGKLTSMEELFRKVRPYLEKLISVVQRRTVSSETQYVRTTDLVIRGLRLVRRKFDRFTGSTTPAVDSRLPRVFHPVRLYKPIHEMMDSIFFMTLLEPETTRARLDSIKGMLAVFKDFVNGLFTRLEIPIQKFNLSRFNSLIDEFGGEIENCSTWTRRADAEEADRIADQIRSEVEKINVLCR